MRKIIITPISIVPLVAIVLAGLSAVYGLFIQNGGGNSLGGGMALFATLFIFGTLAAEQAVVKKFKQRMRAVCEVELLLIAVAVIALIAGNFELSVG